MYEDSSKEKHLTAGVGHKLTPAEKKKYPKGSTIPQEVRDAWFTEDLKEAKEDTRRLLVNMEVPEEVEDIITNMAFNLGRSRLKGFKKMFAALKVGDYKEAAIQMKDSKWYRQVGNRSKSLVKRMENIK